MRIYVHAKNSGKSIRVDDRVSGTEKFNDFVDPDETRSVNVSSNDGETGDIDVYSRMTGSSPWYQVQTSYNVRAEETIDVDDN